MGVIKLQLRQRERPEEEEEKGRRKKEIIIRKNGKETEKRKCGFIIITNVVLLFLVLNFVSCKLSMVLYFAGQPRLCSKRLTQIGPSVSRALSPDLDAVTWIKKNLVRKCYLSKSQSQEKSKIKNRKKVKLYTEDSVYL